MLAKVIIVLSKLLMPYKNCLIIFNVQKCSHVKKESIIYCQVRLVARGVNIDFSALLRSINFCSKLADICYSATPLMLLSERGPIRLRPESMT